MRGNIVEIFPHKEYGVREKCKWIKASHLLSRQSPMSSRSCFDCDISLEDETSQNIAIRGTSP
jgi:hypothetical protein